MTAIDDKWKVLFEQKSEFSGTVVVTEKSIEDEDGKLGLVRRLCFKMGINEDLIQSESYVWFEFVWLRFMSPSVVIRRAGSQYSMLSCAFSSIRYEMKFVAVNHSDWASIRRWCWGCSSLLFTL